MNGATSNIIYLFVKVLTLFSVDDMNFFKFKCSSLKYLVEIYKLLTLFSYCFNLLDAVSSWVGFVWEMLMTIIL